MGLASRWAQLHPATSPPPRQGPGMFWDAAAGNIVLFGGLSGTSTFLNDTWTWDGFNWTQQFPPVSPAGRLLDGEGMTYDAATRTVVLFGGDGSDGYLGDTWVWDGLKKTWTQRFPVSSPSPRRTVLAYDYAAGNVVLFGGNNSSNDYVLGDTWTWNGLDWKRQFPVSSPPRRSMPSLAWDNKLNEVVMFGGAGLPGPYPMNDTWLWSKGNWTQAFPESGQVPSARWASPVTYDPLSGGLMIFGGVVSLDDTWFLFNVP